ncbi:MAG: ribosome recycling factor [Verrucomicrobiales bacterium]|jgi:ribosome recycling factor|nr:ribosome recycling factor [Verrucomicrobiales bacterium]
MPADEILFEAEEKMEKTLRKIQEEFSAVRTGKASPALVEHIRVNAYGTSMSLREMAGITCPEPRLVMIQPWDASNVDPIRKAIEESKLGVHPLVDGKIIRIPIPELSEERRRDLTKVVKKIAEDGKIAIRAIRRDAIDHLKKEQKAGDLTEDELATSEKEVQKLTDVHGEKIDHALTAKEKELMSV